MMIMDIPCIDGKPIDIRSMMLEPLDIPMALYHHYFFESIGTRYEDCTLENFDTDSDPRFTEDKRSAVDRCRAYIDNFSLYGREGRSLIFMGPVGTGKDHLMIATAKALMQRYKKCKVKYTHGLHVISRLRGERFNERELNYLIGQYALPSVLALSDPIPPNEKFDEEDKKMMLRLIDRRYHDRRPIWATLNVRELSDLDEKIGHAAADRLCERAEVVVCYWPSHRTT